FGLSLVDWQKQMKVGAGTALLMTPAVYAIQSLAVRIWRSQHHPVEQMVLGKFSFGIALLAIASTMILAPMIEELLFRGIIQRWLSRLIGGGPSPSRIERDPRFSELLEDDFVPEFDDLSPDNPERTASEQTAEALQQDRDVSSSATAIVV